jgi:hypothetical protein
MSIIRHCIVIALHLINNFLLGFDTCRWIAASHRNVLSISIFRVEGLCPSLDTKVFRARM